MRFSSLEILGFSDAASVWSDPPAAATVDTVEPIRRGRHEAPPPEPETVADWQPQDFGARLAGSNVRWGLVTTIVVLVAGMAAFGYWLYQRPAVLELNSLTDLTSRARAMDAALPTLIEFNGSLLDGDAAADGTELTEVETIARGLFTASGALPGDETGLRTAASQAAGSAIDGVRLAREASSYRAAVAPILVTPELETDPMLIALDEAARSFGTWQLTFDEVRSALPVDVMGDVTEELDALSADLASIMGGYVDALREDDGVGTQRVLADLDARLARVEEMLDSTLEEVQATVAAKVSETAEALRLLTG